MSPGGGRGRVDVELECPGAHASPARVSAAAPAELPASARCGTCSTELRLVLERLGPQGGLEGCLACGHPELYTRKDFPPALGIAIVAVAAALVPFLPKWYPSLIAAAAIDLALYHLAPDVVVCYACAARHRGFSTRPRHPRYDRTIEERLRYGERAVMGSPMRPGGTADAPEPEH